MHNTNLDERTMFHEFNKYQLKALQQLADYRTIFKSEDGKLALKSKPVKGSSTTMQEYIESFTEIFCQNNFADSDYTFIQSKPADGPNLDAWINDIDVKNILQCFTYAIWTNKTYDGYFLNKINDSTAEKLLIRLNNILAEKNKQQKVIGTKVTILQSQMNPTQIS